MTFGVSRSDFGRSPVWRPSFFPRALAAARPDLTRADQISLELGNAGEKRSQYAAMRRRQIEGHTIHGDDKHFPAF
jgi:hypothetical protein